MNKSELATRLKVEKVPETLYCLEGGLPNDRVCLEKNSIGWQVYYSERGQKYDERLFFTEEEACNYLYMWVKKVLDHMKRD